MAKKHKRGLHTSIPKDLRNAVLALEKRPDVTRLILGPSESARHRYSPGTIRYAMDMAGGIKARGYTGTGVMDLYIYCNDPAAIRDVLTAE